MNVLVTGCAGYIGSHTCVELLGAGHQVVAHDNFSNSSPEALRRVEQITGKSLTVVRNDIHDQGVREATIRQCACDAVIHFAGLKAVGGSVEKPFDYFDNNVGGTLSLLRAMPATGVKTLVFSSPATVYGEPQRLPLTEHHPLSVTNPYGRAKLMVENILRYFNPVGAQASRTIGEDPQGTPNNFMPYVAQVTVRRREKLSVWGADYPTAGGTGVRDYIHVVDLALGHLKALHGLNQPQCFAANPGAGVSYNVLDVVRAFEQESSRPGDVAACYAKPILSEKKLGWTVACDLASMCRDYWNWQIKNPKGYL